MQQQINTTESIQTSQPPASLTYCLYARKSSEADERQALSIDSQIKEMLEMAITKKIHIGHVFKESHSAKSSNQRPIFNQMIQEVKSGKFQAILTWAPDRLSRNAGDLGSIVDLMDQKILHEIRTPTQVFTNSPNEKFLLMILGSQAKLENDHKGVNVKRGMKTKCEMGWRPCPPPLGYLHDRYADKGKKKVFLDPERAPVIKEMFERVVYHGQSGRDILDWVNHETNFTTKKNKKMVLSMVYKTLKNPFYYGEFEYPVNSGKWYQGAHEPIITKELFRETQERLRTSASLARSKPGTREYAFTKLIKCGECQSSITAEEKLKKVKYDGSTRRYVYYHCTRYNNRSCKQPYIREEDLIEQLGTVIDKIELDQIKANDKIKKDLERYEKLVSTLIKHKGPQAADTENVNIRDYAKYILSEGSVHEKRELMTCFKSRLELKDSKVKIIKKK